MDSTTLSLKSLKALVTLAQQNVRMGGCGRCQERKQSMTGSDGAGVQADMVPALGFLFVEGVCEIFQQLGSLSGCSADLNLGRGYWEEGRGN